MPTQIRNCQAARIRSLPQNITKQQLARNPSHKRPRINLTLKPLKDLRMKNKLTLFKAIVTRDLKGTGRLGSTEKQNHSETYEVHTQEKPGALQ